MLEDFLFCTDLLLSTYVPTEQWNAGHCVATLSEMYAINASTLCYTQWAVYGSQTIATTQELSWHTEADAHITGDIHKLHTDSAHCAVSTRGWLKLLSDVLVAVTLLRFILQPVSHVTLSGKLDWGVSFSSLHIGTWPFATRCCCWCSVYVATWSHWWIDRKHSHPLCCPAVALIAVATEQVGPRVQVVSVLVVAVMCIEFEFTNDANFICERVYLQ